MSIREKRTSISQFAAALLAHPAIPLDDAEEELLFQFEHSGEWLPDDLTLVAHWYWRAPAVLLGS